MLFAVCHDYLGMENGDIPDENIWATSTLLTHPPNLYIAGKGRLNGPSTWVAHQHDDYPWIQAIIGYQTYVSGLVTQGGGSLASGHWVKTLKVSTFAMSTNDAEVFVKDEQGRVKVNCIFPLLNSRVYFIPLSYSFTFLLSLPSLPSNLLSLSSNARILLTLRLSSAC